MTDAARTALVDMRNIRVAFGGVHAVENVNIDLFSGEVIGLVGGNGAGKSTLMRVLSGAHAADTGEILIDGQVAAIVACPDDVAQLVGVWVTAGGTRDQIAWVQYRRGHQELWMAELGSLEARSGRR